MSLLPFLLEESFRPRPQRNNWISIISPEDVLHPIRSALQELAEIEKDNSITFDKNQFQASIDVQQFKPEEITVKQSGNTVTIEGKHEEKQDEHGYISRHFVRRYELPEDCDFQKVQSKLSSDGVLSITAPKKPEGQQEEYKTIPITMTGPVQKAEKQQKDKEIKNKL